MPHRIQMQFAPPWVKPRTSKMLEKNLSDVFQIHPSQRKKSYCGMKNVRANASYYSYPNLFIQVQNVLHIYLGLICFSIYPSEREREREGDIPCPFSEELPPLPALPITFPPELHHSRTERTATNRKGKRVRSQPGAG